MSHLDRSFCLLFVLRSEWGTNSGRVTFSFDYLKDSQIILQNTFPQVIRYSELTG